MTGFAWPYMFLFLLLPFFVRKFLFDGDAENSEALKIPFYKDIASLPGNKASAPLFKGGRLKLLFLFFIWSLLVAAAARPQWTGDVQPVMQKARNMIMVADISGSMENPDFFYKDIRITRFQALKLAASDFLDKRKGDRVGLVVFGTDAYEYVPLTPDLETTKKMLSELDVGFAGKYTAIGDALGLALKNIKDIPAKDKVTILLSDGSANAGVINVEQALKSAKEMNVKIYTVGIGAKEIEIDNGFGMVYTLNPSEDLDEETLTKIAKETGGKYYRAYDTKEFSKIYEDINKLEPVNSETIFLRPIKELFYYPLGLALMLSVLAVFILRKRER